MVENVTPSRGYQEPAPTNLLRDDVNRLIAALRSIDVDAASLFTEVAGKAPAAHTHAQGDIVGLTDALAGKSSIGHTHSLDDLSDVSGAAAAPTSGGYVLVKTQTGWAPAQASSLMGAHQHAIGDVTGLSDALAAKASLAGADFTGPIKVTTAGSYAYFGDGGIDLYRVGGNAYFDWKGSDAVDFTVRWQLNAAAKTISMIADSGSAILTINGGTAWHSGNDGSGSGMDADLWRGKSLADDTLLPLQLRTDGRTTSDLGGAVDSGFHKVPAGSANTPDGAAAWFVYTQKYDANAIYQIAVEAGVATPRTFRRIRAAGAWGSWFRIWKTAAEIDAALPGRLGATANTVTDWNNATSDGFWMATGAANAPESGKWFLGFTVNHGAAGYCRQTVWAMTEATAANRKTYERDQIGGSWTAWRRVYASAEEIGEVGGGLKLLQTVTLASVASVDFTLPAGYANFVFEFESVLPSLDGANVLGMQLSADGGATFATSGYLTIGLLAISGGWYRYSGGASYIGLNGNGIQKGDGSLGAMGRVILSAHESATRRTQVLTHFGHIRNDGAFSWSNGAGQQSTAAVTNAIRIILTGVASSVMQSGVIRMYGTKG